MLFLAGIFSSLASLLVGLASPTAQVADVRESVLKVFSSVSPPNPFRPWEVTPPSDVTGSGVVIEGGRILTNAHVVAYAQQIYVQPHGSSDKLDATVEFIAEDCDLATVVLDDKEGIAGLQPIPLAADLPSLQTKVSVLGYPTGGDSLSVTEGVVSRIEFALYRFDTSALRIQVDAAINPGNSGGPGIVDGKITGVVFSRFAEGENIGYLIPAEVIRHFLDDCTADGKYDGFPRINALGSTLENPTLRRYLGLGRDDTGVVVHRVFRPEIADLLRPWDVVAACDGIRIDNGGNIAIADGVRVGWGYLVARKPTGSSVSLEIIRRGERLTVEIPTTTETNAVVEKMATVRPTYFVYGGLVFSPVTSEMLYAIPQRALAAMAGNGALLAKRMGDQRREQGEELVVTCCPILPHKLTKGYDIGMLWVVTRLNGQVIRNLRQMIELIKQNKEEFLVFEFGEMGDGKVVLDPALVEQYASEILRNNNIAAPCSEDLRDLWP
ncbi:MAG: trypsin-like peptidase domain-containing protein [Planctomycetota bacterium]